LVHGLFDAAQVQPGVLAMAGLAVGTFSLTLGESERKVGSSWSRVGVLAVTIAVSAVGYTLMSAPADVAKAVEPTETAESASQVLESVASRPVASASISVLLARSYAGAGLFVQARQWVDRSVEQEPLDWVGWALGAQVADAVGDASLAGVNAEAALRAGATGSTEGAMVVVQLAPVDSPSRRSAVVSLVRRFPAVLGTTYWSEMRVSDGEPVVMDAAQMGSACQILTALGESGALADPEAGDLAALCRSQVDGGGIVNIDSNESEHVIGVAGLFYDALYRHGDDTMRSLVSRLRDSGDSRLARRIRGIAALQTGDVALARRELASGAALGDLVSVNLLLSRGDLSQEARALVVSQGYGILASLRPFGLRDGRLVASELNHWWGLATYLPTFQEGPLLASDWEDAFPSFSKEFLELAEDT